MKLDQAKIIQFSRIIFFVVQVVIVAYFFLSRLMLPSHPQLGIISLPELGLLMVFYSSLVAVIYEKRESLIKPKIINLISGIILFSIAVLISLFTAYPTVKVRTEAEEFTSSHQQAAQSGAQLGELVRRNTISKEDAQAQINAQFTEETTQKLATKALEEKVTTEKTVNEVTEELFPTIPVRFKEWTCNSVGCSFADESNIWTISTQARVVAPFLLLLSFVAIVISVYAMEMKRLFSRFRIFSWQST